MDEKKQSIGVISAVLIASILCISAMASEVSWSRLRGKVKKIDGKKQEITIQNKEKDYITVKDDDDVLIVRDKAEILLKDINLDDDVTLLYMPRAAAPKGEEEPPIGSTYPPVRR